MNHLSSPSADRSPRNTAPNNGQIRLNDLPDEMLGLIFSSISPDDNATLSSLAQVSHRILGHVSVTSLKANFLAAEQAFPSMQAEQKTELIGNLSAWLIQIENQIPSSDVLHCWDRLCDMVSAGSLDIFQQLTCLQSMMCSFITSPLFMSDDGQPVYYRIQDAITLAVLHIDTMTDETRAIMANSVLFV